MVSKFITFTKGFITLVKYRFPSPILWFYGGIGDDLLLTAVARQWHRHHGGTITVASAYPGLFEGNKDIRCVIPSTHSLQRVAPLFCRMVHPTYSPLDPLQGRKMVPDMPMIAKMCESIGLPVPDECRPYVFLSDHERVVGHAFANAVLLQPTGRGARWHISNNEWGWEKFQRVVLELSDEIRFVQIGGPKDALLQGVEDARGRPFRETAAMLAGSAGFLGQPGFHMHLARSVDCRSVIIYGGREKAWQSGYAHNINLETHPPCSPCWQENECDFERKCLSEITTDKVVQAVRDLVGKRVRVSA